MKKNLQMINMGYKIATIHNFYDYNPVKLHISYIFFKAINSG